MTRINLAICAFSFSALLAGAEKTDQTTAGAAAAYTATPENFVGSPGNIRINILRWSTDAERDKLMDAWNLKSAEGGRGGRGGAGRGAAGRGGRGGPEEQNAAPRPAPEAMLAKALKESTTVGYLWSNEVAGYAIRYAGRMQNPDGSETITLLTERRLGAVNDAWKPSGAEPLPYDFSLIELRLKANGNGEGKTSLTGKVVAENEHKALVLQNFDSLPVELTHVQRLQASQK